MQIAVVGQEEFVLGYRMVGIGSCHPVEGDEDLDVKVRELMADPDIGILILKQEDVGKLSKRTLADIEKSVMPVVITVGKEKDTVLQDRVKAVMGVDLWM